MILKFLKKLTEYRISHKNKKINVLKTFPLFESHGWGNKSKRTKLTIQSINQVIPGLSKFTFLSEENRNFKKQIEKFLVTTAEKEVLANLFNKYGSDKSNQHNYHLIYSSILNPKKDIKKIFEIGLGTNYPEIVSTMGSDGKPGASLKAFRDYCANCIVYGADYDKRILFKDERIKTFFVDQTSPSTFDQLDENIGNDFDLMIDDGLHSPNANLHSLYFFIKKLRVGGYGVIEDISPLTQNLWKIVTDLLKENFLSALIETKNSSIFIIKRVN